MHHQHTKSHSHTNVFLTAVESLEASVISRFPLSPSSAGTRMNTSDTSINTVQCCKDHHILHEYDNINIMNTLLYQTEHSRITDTQCTVTYIDRIYNWLVTECPCDLVL